MSLPPMNRAGRYQPRRQLLGGIRTHQESAFPRRTEEMRARDCGDGLNSPSRRIRGRLAGALPSRWNPVSIRSVLPRIGPGRSDDPVAPRAQSVNLIEKDSEM